MFYSFKQSNGVRAMSTSVGHPLSPAAPMADAVPFRGGAARTPRRHHGRMPAQAAAPREPAPFVSDAEERAYERRDLRGVAWAFLYEIRHSPEYIKLAAPAASMMRVILALGEEPEDRALAIAEAAVVGSVLHGIAPRDEAGWAIAERVFGEETLEDLRHWRPRRGWFGHSPGEFCDCGCRWRGATRPAATDAAAAGASSARSP